MTDRFYPKGKQSAYGVWKTTYEVANELRSYERSPFPPGCSVHMPGTRETFGYSTPGPLAHRLAKPNLTLREEIDIPNPREHHALPRSMIADEHETFQNHDVPEMMRSYRSPVATSSFSPSSLRKSNMMRNSRSLPALQKTPIIPRVSEPTQPVERMEDEHFSYFVPQGLQNESQEKLYASSTISKLHKERRISFPFKADGTGFRSQGNDNAWWPEGGNISSSTSYRSQFGEKPKFFRHSPLDTANPSGELLS